MAEDLKHDQGHIKIEEDVATPAATPVETTDRGMFDFMGKKEEEKKPHEEKIATEFDQKVHVSEPEKKKGGLLEKLHRSGSSSSSSSSEEEVEEDGKKIRRKKEKKGLKEKIKEKISGEKKEGEHHETHVPVEKCDETVHVEPAGHEGEEKKGFLDKIKEKLPGGGQKKPGEVSPPSAPAAPPPAECASPDSEAKEKKGFLDKIKEKLPGYHTKTEEEKEKEGHASH